jgi:branched-chain amino acid transport system permease protein
MNLTSQLLINALQIGSVYVVFALGLTLIFGVMRIINFAHGEFFTLAGLTIATLVPAISSATGLPTWAAYGLSFLIAIAAMALLGALLFKTVFVKFVGDPIGALIMSLGLSMLMQSLFTSWFGASPRRVSSLFPGAVSLLGGRISNDRLIVFVLAMVLTAALWFLIQRTKLGNALRAVAEDREAAVLQGIDDRKCVLWGFVIGCVLAALAGGLIAPTTVLTPIIGADYLTKAFIIIIVGGAGSMGGAVLGGMLLGVIESFAGFYFDSTSALILLLALVSIVLLVRPQGIMGHATR